MRPVLIFVTLLAVCILPSVAVCQWKEPPSTGSPDNNLPDRTTLVGQSGLGPMISAKLVNAAANAKMHKTVVQVQTDGVSIVDPASHQQPKLDEGHIGYQLDDHNRIDSTALVYEFADVGAGDHRIRISLLSNDNRPMGKEQILKVHVP